MKSCEGLEGPTLQHLQHHDLRSGAYDELRSPRHHSFRSFVNDRYIVSSFISLTVHIRCVEIDSTGEM